MASPPLKPTDAQHQCAHYAPPCQTSIQQQANPKSFWAAPLDDPIALFTFVIAMAAVCQLVASIFLWLTTRSAVRLGRDEFNATHRPHITVHALEFISDPLGVTDGTETIGASVLCFNAGDNRAKRVEARAQILATYDLAVDVERPLVASFEDVVSGVKLKFKVGSDRAVNALRGDAPPTQCVGTIAYWDNSDNSGVRRETGFCLELRNPDRPEWVEITHRPEHNYEY